MIPLNQQTLFQKGALPIPDAKSPVPPPSLLYTIIPTAVRIKIPRFPSLRSWPSRSRSQCRTLTIHPWSESTGAEIEPLSHYSRPSSSRSSSPTLSSSTMTGNREPTWKYANQGTFLPPQSLTDRPGLTNPRPSFTRNRRLRIPVPAPQKPRLQPPTLHPRPHIPPTRPPFKPHKPRNPNHPKRPPPIPPNPFTPTAPISPAGTRSLPPPPHCRLLHPTALPPRPPPPSAYKTSTSQRLPI